MHTVAVAMDYGGLAMLAFMALYGLMAWFRRGRGAAGPAQLSDECTLLLNLAATAAQERGDPVVGLAHLLGVASTSPALVPLVHGSGMSLDALRQHAVAEFGPQGPPLDAHPAFDARLEACLMHALNRDEEPAKADATSESLSGEPQGPSSASAAELSEMASAAPEKSVAVAPSPSRVELSDLLSAVAECGAGRLKQWALQLTLPRQKVTSDDSDLCVIYLINNDVISVDDALQLLRMELDLPVEECLLLLFCAQVRGVAALGPYPRQLAEARCRAVGRLAEELGVRLELRAESTSAAI